MKSKAVVIQNDPKQSELTRDLVRGLSPDMDVDVVNDLSTVYHWLGQTHYPLIILDFDAVGPEEDPMKALEGIRRMTPSSSVIVLTSHPEVDQAVATIRLGAEDYVRKPYNIESLQLAIKRSLDRKQLFDENSVISGYLNLATCCQMISASLDQQRIFGIVQSYIRREVQSEYAAIYRLEKGELVPVPVDQVETRSRRRSLSEVLDVAIHSAQAGAVITDAKEGYRWIERAPMSPGLFLFRFRSVGDSEFVCVCLAPEKPKTLDAFDSRMALLRAQLEVSGKNIEKYLGVQHLVFVDDATGLYNTRYLYNILEREAAAHQATGRSFAILFMDGDRFKGINDTYGHLAGTKLLYELGAQLKSFVRGRDTVFRYGGDEFVAVLSNCDLQTAKQVAERIRAKVEKYVFLKDEQKNIHITVSIGVALFPDHAGTIKEVIEAADHAMYAAKRHTRNSVFIAEIPSSDPEKIQTRSE